MRRLAAVACASFVATGAAHADETRDTRGEVGARSGFAFPAGSFERGARASDETFGVVPFAIDGAMRVHERLSIGLFFQYGIVTPKLCASSSDCSSSLGRDVVLGALARWHVARVGVFVPSLDGSLGYEWFSSKLSDHAVASTRGHRGVLFALDAFFAIALSRRVTLGPTLGVAFGIADHVSIDAPGVSTSSAVDGHAWHAWPRLGVRVVVAL